MVQKRPLGENIKRLCTEKDIPISFLEDKVGYSPGTISRWIATENVDFNVLTKLVSIADILDVSLDELLGRPQTTVAVSSNSPSANLIRCLIESTSANKLSWDRLAPQSVLGLTTSQIPNTDSGRSISDVWWMQHDNLVFLLSCYCDDIDDNSESLELDLYGWAGHDLPVYQIHCDELKDLQQLYTCILVQQTHHSLSDVMQIGSKISSHTSLSIKPSPPHSKTIEFSGINHG